MSEKNYDWKRFWCPRSGHINLTEDGYLCDPDQKWGNMYYPNLVSLEEIAEIPCLILLGEPGIGKSQELENFKGLTEKKICNPNQVLLINLRSCTNLKEDLFRNKIFTDWLGDSYHLYLFLDSLDEGLLNIKTVATGLIDELQGSKYQDHINRLHLRLACRTFVFPEILEEGLKKLWQEANFSVYELAPLRRKDIIKAAEEEGFYADDFLKEVYKKSVVPLAIKPITLNFLFNIYRRYGDQFPPDQKRHELYLEGCKCLCEEVNKGRRASDQVGNLDRDQRLVVAARIAAITIFANRFAVWSGVDVGTVPDEDVYIQILCVGHEKANERQFEVKREVIKEVLDTGLFTSRGLNRMGWAHQTYAEFLAAWYLTQHKTPLVQIKQLIFSSEDPDHKLIPQLHETAAWLASMNPDILQGILKTDPDVLLQSDVPTDAKIRLSIVDNLLKQYEEGKLFDRSGNNYRHYAKLNHPGLVEQLRPYICDSSKPIDVRYLAINIAKACEVVGLQDELVKLSLDSSQFIDLRANAAHTICVVGNAATKLKLKPLAIAQLSEDEDDRLKGYAIQSLWPDHLTVEELFQALIPPKKSIYFGEYQWFIGYELVPRLEKDHLVFALDWIKEQGVRYSRHPFEELADSILLKAWENFGLPGVAESFTQVALIQWREDQEIITHDLDLQERLASLIVKDHDKRHTFTEQVILVISQIKEDPYFALDHLRENILIAEDIFWIIQKIQASGCEKVQKVWAKLLQSSFNRQNVKQIDAIIAATQINSVLEQIFAPSFSPIELNSSQADALRTDHLRMKKVKKDRKTLPLLDPPPKDRVIQCLDELESGNLDAWCQLNMEMMLKPESRSYDHGFELNLTQLPGWQEADEATRRRIVEYAKEYIEKQDNIDYNWIGTNTFKSLDRVYCRTLLLVWQKCPEFYENLSFQIWKKWTPVIVASQIYTQDSGLELIECAYRNACEQFIETVIFLIDKDNQRDDHLFVISHLDKCWDEQLKLMLLEKAKDPLLKPKCTGQLLAELLKREFAGTEEFAKSLITSPLQAAGSERKKAVIAAKIMIENSNRLPWSLIWKVIQEDSLFGREVFELVYDSQRILLNLMEAQLADFYIWLLEQYPYDEDPDRTDDTVTAKDRIIELRRSVLWQLKEQGTSEACTHIKRLIQKLPDITWLNKILIDAQVNMRRETWKPVKPEEFFQFVFNQHKRLIQSGQHLLDVLIESLERLELELQGETPAVRDLWDEIGKENKIFKPIDENPFSDYVKRFLDRDLMSRGIIANREVEIRRKHGGNPGERTDIHIDAVWKNSNGEYNSITVIIEVKGSWHPEVNTAMQTQLVERYLADNSCQYGLYLVGWFNCQQWDDKDSKKKKAPKITLDKARTQFNAQAEELSSSGRVVRAYILNTALR